MKKNRIVSFIAALMAALVLAGCTVPMDKESVGTTSKVRETSDPSSIGPEDDFYEYINAEFFRNAVQDSLIATRGAYDVIQKKVDGEITSIVRDIANGDRSTYLPGSNEQIVYDAYHQFCDYTIGNSSYRESVDAFVTEDFLDAYNRIQGVSSCDELLRVAGDISNEFGVNLLTPSRTMIDIYDSTRNTLVLTYMDFGMGGHFVGVSEDDYYADYLQEDIHSALYLIDDSFDATEVRANNALSLIIGIAEHTNYVAESFENVQFIWVSYTNQEIDDMCPNIGVDGIYSMLGMTSNDNRSGEIVVFDEEQLSYIDSIFTEENLQAFKDIASYSFVNEYVMVLPRSLGGSNVFYTNDNAAIAFINDYFEREIGELYAEHCMDENAINDVINMTYDIIGEYEVLINESEWLEAETKAGIISKLENITLFIGADGPHDINPADSEVIGDNAYITIKNARSKMHRNSVEELNNPASGNGFTNMAPQVANACYSPFMNCITITLAMMNGTMYNPDASYATNMGGIGHVIAHEISHAFDSDCINYDSNGNYNPGWLCEDDMNDYAELEAQFIEYYSSYNVLGDQHVNGELTLSENLADVSAMECILRIITDNNERQEVFENYARNYASIIPVPIVRLLLVYDVHSPDKIRINAVVALFDCFYEIYGVEEGDAMYVAPENRIHRW